MNSERHRGHPGILTFSFSQFLFSISRSFFSRDGGVLLPVEFLDVDICLIIACLLMFPLAFDTVFMFYFSLFHI